MKWTYGQMFWMQSLKGEIRDGVARWYWNEPGLQTLQMGDNW